ncbi:MAG: 5-methyltetrahydropteroyltriglutamate--homocysteine S-methyltransferase [bacterium]
MVRTTNLGYPRIGRNRELKKTTESFWKGKTDVQTLRATVRRLEAESITLQKSKGLDLVPVNDMSLYDHVLDAACAFLATPSRYGASAGSVDLETYFAMARGSEKAPALEMTKWFDTNYHYIVPELAGEFRLAPEKALAALWHGRSLGVAAKPVIVGPFTLVTLAKGQPRGGRSAALAALAPLYAELIALLTKEGAAAVQLDEPALVRDLDEADLRAVEDVYKAIAKSAGGARIHLATYFGRLGDAYPRVMKLPVAAIHIDFVRDPGSLADFAKHGFPKDKELVAGIVNGRNVWRTDLDAALATVRTIAKTVDPARLWLAPSCSLLHLPHSVAQETALDPTIKRWLAYADERLDEVALLARALQNGEKAIAGALEESRSIAAERKKHPLAVNKAVRARVAALSEKDFQREPFAARSAEQDARLNLPPLPTTSIGSFPQTQELRKARQSFKRGEMTAGAYDAFIRAETEKVVRLQEEIGFDVLVHGEFERSDMVDHFAERLSGTAFIEGWVQSYGTRYVRPPLIYGDVSRPEPMTVEMSRFAQSLTGKPMKGMLTGPVTILQWSFPREDLSRAEIANQIALAIRDETVDLEAAGIPIVQIDEPAFREGYPLRRADRDGYIRWAVRAFRLSSSGVRADTQIHSHMCYSEFNEIIVAIQDLDADVVSIECSRSGGELLGVFREHRYERGIGPGVYDVHSERVPTRAEIVAILERAVASIPPERLWVNPDCGLKTRGYPETIPSLKNLVAAALDVRASRSVVGAGRGRS